MNYSISKTIKNISFDEAKQKVTEELKKEGFGVLTQIDMKTTFKNKLDVDFKPYTILGACNPSYAYKALQEEDQIGTMLPCNVVVQENKDGSIKVSAVNPVASLISVDNENMVIIAGEVEQKLQRVIQDLDE